VGGWRLGLVLALLAASAGLASSQETSATPSIEISATSFRVITNDGRVLASPDLIGAVLDASDETGRIMTVRIDVVSRDPADLDGDVWLHHFSVLDPNTESWRELCRPGPDGVAAGFPVGGDWTKDGRHLRGSSGFTVTCASGAVGKCVRFGYKPWREVNGVSLWDYHQACVRMVTADYGGDGVSQTRDGTLVDFFDRLGIQRSQPAPGSGELKFEAAWGPDGAVCIRRTRIPELVSTDELAQRYARLAGHIGPDCSDKVDALLWNRS
jgi:hypothetical protein